MNSKIIFLIFLGILIILNFIDGTGFQGKTLWDWTELLLFPGTITYLIWSLENREEKISRDISLDQFRESLLHDYFDAMANIDEFGFFEEEVEDENGYEIKPEPGKNVGWFKTVSITNKLDPERRRLVLDFLYYSNLIFRTEKPPYAVVNLFGANFSDADLSGIYLSNTNFRHVNFKNCKFTKAHMPYSRMVECDLTNAVFDNANTPGIDFSDSDLTNASFINTNMLCANLNRSKINVEHLRNVKSLAGTIMPDGSLYDGSFNLQADIEEAKEHRYNPNDPISLQKFYVEAREKLLDDFYQ
ncbi:MAG: pentapeptide repeat-containing protein [Anaerolineales bacterium]|jgi:hypothetical protein